MLSQVHSDLHFVHATVQKLKMNWIYFKINSGIFFLISLWEQRIATNTIYKTMTDLFNWYIELNDNSIFKMVEQKCSVQG